MAVVIGNCAVACDPLTAMTRPSGVRADGERATRFSSDMPEPVRCLRPEGLKFAIKTRLETSRTLCRSVIHAGTVKNSMPAVRELN